MIDTTTDSVTSALDVGGDPGALALTQDGHYAYVNNAGSDAVLVIDTSS